jgi:hypothetical protein
MKTRQWLILCSLASIAACTKRDFNTSDNSQPLAWAVTSNGWTAADEQGFSDYVKKIGDARKAGQCSAVAQCMAMVPPGNLPAEKLTENFKPDCGRLAFLLRAYYAYRMRLPFAYSEIDNPTLEGRYTAGGNRVTGHTDQADFDYLEDFFGSAVGSFFTAYYRIPASTDIKSPNAFADIYPVSMSHDGVRPGTVYYDTNGHIAIVLDVKADGSIDTWNGHPDGSNSLRTFNTVNFAPPSSSRNLGGFLRFRGWKTKGNSADLRAIPNPEQPSFSLEQYGTRMHNGKEYTNYFEWVKARLGNGGKTNPLLQFRGMVEELCTKLQDRNVSVQKAIDAGLSNAKHPGLPPNIFGAEGDWESYSTPSGDLRSKMGYSELYSLVKQSISAIAANNRADYDFAGTANDLAKAYMSAWNEYNAKPTCVANARNSKGGAMPITLQTALKTTFDWSFDPYHCEELRWGQTGTATCNSGADKIDIYNKEAKLRWNTVKNSAVTTDYEYGNNSTKPATDFMPIIQPLL